MCAYRIVPGTNGVLIERYTDSPTVEKIPAGVYTIADIKEDSVTLLRKPEALSLPTKIYGDHHRRKAIILRALNTREQSVGVLLLGLKGTGKTILAHDLANTAVESGHPVFLIDRYVPANVLRFLHKLANSECVFMFDEFSTYYSDDQERKHLLTFFSDRDVKKALFLIMQNERKDIPDAFLDRTGRFLFRFEYSHITRSEAVEIIDDYIVHEESRNVLVDYCEQQQMTPDTLISLLEQLKYFPPEDLGYLLTVLNIPRPVYVNVELGVAFSPETPLPEGWYVDVSRRDAKRFVVNFIGPDKQCFEATVLDMGNPDPGRGGKFTTERQYQGGILPTVLDVFYDVRTLAVGSIEEYIPPIVKTVDYPVKKKKETEKSN